MQDLHLRNRKRSSCFSLSLMRSLSAMALFHKPSLPPSGVSATATPASAPRGSRGGCSASASTTQRGTTARDVTLFTRTDPGPGLPGTPPTSAWVSIRLLACCHTRLKTKTQLPTTRLSSSIREHQNSRWWLLKLWSAVRFKNCCLDWGDAPLVEKEKKRFYLSVKFLSC